METCDNNHEIELTVTYKHIAKIIHGKPKGFHSEQLPSVRKIHRVRQLYYMSNLKII